MTSLAQTQIEIKPYFPVQCDPIQHNGDKPYLNWQSHIQKISEDDDLVTFRFTTTYGFCNDGLLERRNVKPESLALILMKRKISFGKDKGVVRQSLKVISASDVEVEITFDKNFCFKNRNNPEKEQIHVRNYDLLYQPGDYLSQVYMQNNQMVKYTYPLRFPWKLILTEVTRTQTTLQVK